MKVELNRITAEGLLIEESINSEDLDLDTEEIKFTLPIRVNASVYKISNVVSVSLELSASFHTFCSRCLKDIEIPLKRYLRLNYEVKANQEFIELDEDIREDIILSYPVKFLCSPNCLGLCPKCGKDLNEGKCNCI